MRNASIRVAAWASAGLLISIGWGLYFANANKSIPVEPAVYALARLTQPIAAVLLYLKPSFALGLTQVIVWNAAAYALAGLIVETLRRHRALHVSR